MSSNIIITRRNQEQVILRANLGDKKTAAALKKIGMKVPQARSKDGGAHWFSPDELLIFVEDGKASVEKIKPALPLRHLVHDVSGARQVFSLTGRYLRDVLAKGAPRDLREVKIGEVVRTRLGQVAVAFWFLSEEEVELVCFRSVADYVEKWLEVACQEDGLPVL